MVEGERGPDHPVNLVLHQGEGAPIDRRSGVHLAQEVHSAILGRVQAARSGNACLHQLVGRVGVGGGSARDPHEGTATWPNRAENDLELRQAPGSGALDRGQGVHEGVAHGGIAVAHADHNSHLSPRLHHLVGYASAEDASSAWQRHALSSCGCGCASSSACSEALRGLARDASCLVASQHGSHVLAHANGQGCLVILDRLHVVDQVRPRQRARQQLLQEADADALQVHETCGKAPAQGVKDLARHANGRGQR